MDALLGKVWESGKRIRRGMMTISSGGKSNWVIEHVFTGSSRQRLDNGDEEALKWAALQKLPTYDRLRTTLMRLSADDQNIDKLIHKEVDVRKLALMERQAFIQRLLKVAEEDNERLLLDVRRRIDRVGITLAQVEVRFEHFTIDAECHAGSQALPTLWNSFRNSVDSLLGMIGLPRNNKTVLTILEDANGILKASRMILLLGPLQSGKTTLLRALAGKLDADLKVKGQITYNGHGLDEFVPLKTSAYISQHDVLAPDMTVRETLDFSARCQGVGSKRDGKKKLGYFQTLKLISS